MSTLSSFNAEIKLTILGDLTAGKTSLLGRYFYEYYIENITGNTSLSFSKIVNVDGEDNTLVKINAWDTAGQEIYMRMAPMYFRKSNVLLVCFDNQTTFESVQGWIETATVNCPIILVLTKSDLKSSRLPDEHSIWKLRQSNNNLPYFKTSSVDGSGINELFKEAVKLGYNHYLLNREPEIINVDNNNNNYNYNYFYNRC